MTNPIAKAIAKIGVAMGYGQFEDYKGSSVEDMLESFASIAQEKGGSSGGVFVVNITGDSPAKFVFDKTAAEVFAAMQTMPVVVAASINGTVVWGNLVLAGKQGTNYTFYAYCNGDRPDTFTAASDDSYPSRSGD